MSLISSANLRHKFDSLLELVMQTSVISGNMQLNCNIFLRIIASMEDFNAINNNCLAR